MAGGPLALGEFGLRQHQAKTAPTAGPSPGGRWGDSFSCRGAVIPGGPSTGPGPLTGLWKQTLRAFSLCSKISQRRMECTQGSARPLLREPPGLSAGQGLQEAAAGGGGWGARGKRRRASATAPAEVSLCLGPVSPPL